MTYAFFLILFFGCLNNPSPKTQGKQLTVNNNSDSTYFYKYVAIFRFDSTQTDSLLISELWFIHDSLIKKTGYEYRLPLNESLSDIIVKDRIVDSAINYRSVYETFNPKVCQTGGQSAWNKYIFKYDDRGRPINVKHYKAFFNDNEESQKDYMDSANPKYSLSEISNLQYDSNCVTQTSKALSYKCAESIKIVTDKNHKTLSEEFNSEGVSVSFGEKYKIKYRAYYKYGKDHN